MFKISSLFYCFLDQLGVGVLDALRAEDFDFPAELKDPGEKGGADGDLGGEGKVFLVSLARTVFFAIDLLVAGLAPVSNADVATQLPGVVDAGQTRELFGQDAALFTVINFDDSTASISSFNSGSSKRRPER